ncbi:MAG: GNAT family N-acetyltransferase [Theionarchaea archaeon]|nr:GNAT family N-acetyltransferase [Theionarchaea archaeon]
MNFIIDFARSRGYEQVKLFVIDANTKAKTFYHKMGFIS